MPSCSQKGKMMAVEEEYTEGFERDQRMQEDRTMGDGGEQAYSERQHQKILSDGDPPRCVIGSLFHFS